MEDSSPKTVWSLKISEKLIGLRNQVMKASCVNVFGLTQMINQEDNQVREELELDSGQTLPKDFSMTMT